MLFDPFTQASPLSEKARSLAKQTYIFLGFFIALAIVKTFKYGQPGVEDIIAAIIMYVGTAQQNYCYLSTFVLFTFFSFFKVFSKLGEQVQNGKSMVAFFNSFDGYLLNISLLMYIVGYYLSFQGYREMKAISFSQEGRGEYEIIRNQRREGDEETDAFIGKGIRIGD